MLEDQKVVFADRISIGTHSGAFHCDEVLACSMLLYTEAYGSKKPLIVRTRNQELLNKMTCCCDVGGTYEPEKQRFDHHQRTFEEIWRKGDPKLPEIKLSSAGLIYRHFGHEIIKNAVKDVW